jgi:hypothetical protein
MYQNIAVNGLMVIDHRRQGAEAICQGGLELSTEGPNR